MSETTAISQNPGELFNVGSIVTQKNKTKHFYHSSYLFEKLLSICLQPA